MRLVDEYAASQHTGRVYQHAEKVVGQALVEAAYAKELGKKISVELEGVDGVDEEYVKNFYAESSWKKFLSDLFSEADRVRITVGASRTCEDCPDCRECPKDPECPECPHGDECPICHETGVRDTSDTVTDCPDTGPLATAPSDSRAAVTPATDKGGLATDCPDTADSSDAIVGAPMSCAPLDCEPNGRAPDDDASTVRTPDGSATPTDGESAESESKKCTRCLVLLPLSCYGRNRSRPDGYASSCRECEIKRDRERRKALKEGQDGA